jgi:hypothetical protein
MTTRTTGLLPTDTVVSAASSVFPAARVASLRGRLEQEDVITARARQRLALGWGPWGDYRVSESKSLAGATDGLWMITLGKYGLVGITSLTALLLLPATIVMFQLGKARPPTPAALMLAAVVGLYMVDCLVNAMVNPLFGLAAAGVMGGVAMESRSVYKRAATGTPASVSRSVPDDRASICR